MPPGDPTVRHLFAYGTLRRGAEAPPAVVEALRSGGRHVGTGRIAARLHDAGTFPAAVRDPDRRVRGDLWLLAEPRRVLPVVDRYEGHRDDGTGLFRREIVEVRRDDGGAVAAWTYLWTGEVSGMPEVPSGDWLADG